MKTKINNYSELYTALNELNIALNTLFITLEGSGQGLAVQLSKKKKIYNDVSLYFGSELYQSYRNLWGINTNIYLFVSQPIKYINIISIEKEIDSFKQISEENLKTTEDNLKIYNFAGGRKKSTKPKPKGKHDDTTMKDIKELCKANQIKLSRVVEGKRIAYKKNELLTKLKRKKLI